MSKKKPNRNANRQVRGQLEIPDIPAFDRRAIEGMMRRLLTVASENDSDLDTAQQIMYAAFEETSPRKQMALARKALKTSPDCADAYVLLGEYAETLTERIDLYEKGVAAGERALGKEGFKEFDGHFWGFLETRPYMRARAALAECLWQAARRKEAAEHFREMLRLNPNDNQGIRYRLVAMLLELELHDELEQLLKDYKDDGSAEWAYTRALLAFRCDGDTSRARKALTRAMSVNAHVPAYVARLKPMPPQPPLYITPGHEDEAVSYAAQFLPAWKETPGATAWLCKTLKLPLDEGPAQKRQPWNKLQIALSRLPQRQDETWELDVRHVAAAHESEMPSQWMLVALDTAGGNVVHFEFFDGRPKDRETLNFLTAALKAPQDDEPHRPDAIRLTRKSWHNSLQPKLNDIGIDCQLVESLEHIDRWYEMALPQLEQAQRLADEPSPTDADWSNLASLPQRSEETWQVDLQCMPFWVDRDGEPTRPWISLVVEVYSEAILSSAMASDQSPDELLARAIWQALTSPVVGDPHRPGSIHVASDRQREFLEAQLKLLGIHCAAKSDLRRVRALLKELVTHLGDSPQRGALSRSPGVTPGQLGGFFEAAALFFRARPWRNIPGDTVIRVNCERFQSQPWYAVVMGQSGIEQGLALYEDLEFLRRHLEGDLSEDEARRRMSAISTTYGEPFELAPEDLDAAEKYGWPVAGPEAYPCVFRVNPGMALRAPLKWELELLEGCLRAIPEFLGGRQERADISVAMAGTSVTFQLDLLGDVI